MNDKDNEKIVFFDRLTVKKNKKSISGILFLVAKVTVISLGLSLPTDSSNLPSRLGRAALSVGIFGLAAHKVYPEPVSP